MIYKLMITCGVPQGSVLGPTFFILYINDICQISKLLSLVHFADDINVFCSGQNMFWNSNNNVQGQEPSFTS